MQSSQDRVIDPYDDSDSSSPNGEKPKLNINHHIYTPKFKWELDQLYKLFLYIGILFVLVWNLPNTVWSPDSKTWIIVFGALGIWRYFWWFTHFVRAIIYNQIVFEKLRYQSAQLLEDGWRPNKIIFMITVYNESDYIIEQMLAALNREANLTARPFEVYVATADFSGERKIEKIWGWLNQSKYIKLNIVRQRTEGKRAAMAAALRAISRKGIGDNDPVVFMDGDTVLTPGCILKCLPILVLEPTVHAITTNEKNKSANIPTWLQNWFNLRFTQRSMIMQSISLSKKVLTLTGRLSIFRGKVVLEDEFIYLIENDHLTHWLWGDFKFLSGDDKSTWYALLKRGADMLYVPDAVIYTIEELHESPLHRLKENMLRWSGNILRNGWRAIRLGPGRVGLFAWYCLIDQRVIIFTMLAAPIIMISGSLLISSTLLAVYFVWLLFSRLILSFMLFYFNRKINMSFPFILYFNQIGTAFVKLYLLFRLPMQKWANRGEQKLVMQGTKKMFILRRIMSAYMTALFLGVIALVALTYMEILPLLSFNDVDSWIN